MLFSAICNWQYFCFILWRT